MSSTTCIAPACTFPREAGAVFCRICLAAPAGKRGGWISAYKRRTRAGGDVAIDASNITRRLWIGGAPPADRALPAFDVIVLCAEEYQPQLAARGAVVRVPLPDGKLDAAQLERALLAGREVAKHLAAGRTTLVTCYAGRNRSSLVAGLGLGLVTRMSADQIVTLIRARRRADCLTNGYFRAYLRTFIGTGRPTRARVPSPR